MKNAGYSKGEMVETPLGVGEIISEIDGQRGLTGPMGLTGPTGPTGSNGYPVPRWLAELCLAIAESARPSVPRKPWYLRVFGRSK